MPPASLPEHVDYTFDARYHVGDDGEVVFPFSRRDLVIQRLEFAPQPSSESFVDGTRLLRYAPGTEVRARGALRAYPRTDGSMPSLTELLPGAELQR